MPISPNEAQSIRDEQIKKQVDVFITQIDRALKDTPANVTVTREQECVHYAISCCGVLSSEALVSLVAEYLRVGWTNVLINDAYGRPGENDKTVTLVKKIDNQF